MGSLNPGPPEVAVGLGRVASKRVGAAAYGVEEALKNYLHMSNTVRIHNTAVRPPGPAASNQRRSIAPEALGARGTVS